ncbi:hypothetical protein O4160_19975 [Rhodococcus sp. IEGM 1401]|uniref:hypothetical protein n=1 Tax=unclassified Rhodococcus (in: high G+C Gram-positive bacteria) TaxID=192944 RepID=UPI0022B4463B|nr:MULTISPECIES: hypothetical protein [unclassified Rhodococcus (in: high G+C Gram-positive bacteria)]MCZ4563126.1 hypothetical protein [Rhodococcus sp. IEGM 1401]MDI9923249.1 hypothetical protein [Rhodococcus sp. IEGM 1372]MDV8035747.1 hypothetical protein [Rhodococcus sp. IEGM 1414]
MEQVERHSAARLELQKEHTSRLVVLVKLITKRYPSLVDIYEKIEVFNEELGTYDSYWDYDNPISVACNVTSLEPDNSLEQFGAEYTNKIFVKIEYATNDITLRHQAGNLRSKDGLSKYYYIDDDAPGNYSFNVSGVNAQIDALGNLVCHVAYLELAGN